MLKFKLSRWQLEDDFGDKDENIVLGLYPDYSFQDFVSIIISYVD